VYEWIKVPYTQSHNCGCISEDKDNLPILKAQLAFYFFYWITNPQIKTETQKYSCKPTTI